MSKEMIYEPIEDFGLSKKAKSSGLFSKVGIVGCGLVGQNLARVTSYYGLDVVFVEISEQKIEEAFEAIANMLDHRIEHWGLTQSEKRAMLSRIEGTTDINRLAGCDIVVEAIRPVNRGMKVRERKEIFAQIEEVVDPECIIATNSATVVITELSSELKYRERCVSIHFFVSSPDARIIEVVKGLYTSDDNYHKVCKFVSQINRAMIPVDESAGLISVRLFVVLLNEACELLMEGIASLEDIDTTMCIGYGMRSGPFEVADKIGLDKIIRWMENIYSEFGDVKYKPSPVLRKLVRAKHTGLNANHGFYRYDEKGQKIVTAKKYC